MALRASVTGDRSTWNDAPLAGTSGLGGNSDGPNRDIIEIGTASNSADFDQEGDIDGADFLAWQRGLNTPTPTFMHGDANPDGTVTGSDLAIWDARFVASLVVASTAPEPAAALMASLVLRFVVPLQRIEHRGR
jgi:hypothetical protein